MRPQTCPSVEDLKQFRLGRLADAPTAAVEAHLLGCAGCAGRLAGIPLADPLRDALRGVLGRPRLNNPLLARVQQELRARPFRTAAAGQGYQATVAHAAPESDATVGPPAVAVAVAGCGLYPFLSAPRGPGEIGWLGGFRVLGVLGEGGMGIVLRAEDVRLQREVALKVMKPLLAADGVAVSRFLREARATARLSHDHVVAIHHTGEANGVPFLAMPLLQGETLEDRLRREGMLATAEVLRIGGEAAEGLAAAHAVGLTHRDIKPGNLWLEAPSGRVKVLDFGLASMPSAEGEKTLPGTILGTPGYMAPEQTEGQADHRADLFSLGCVLYRMATGRPPIKGATMMEKIRNTLFAEPTPPQQVNPALPAPLCQLIVQLLARKPEERPGTALAVARVLQSLQGQLAPGAAGSVTAALPAPAAAPAAAPRRPLARRWLLIAGAAVVGLGIFLASRGGRQPRTIDPPDTKAGTPVAGRLPYEPVRPNGEAQSVSAVAADQSFQGTWVTHPEPIPGIKAWSIETNQVGAAYPVAFERSNDGRLLILYTGGWYQFDEGACGLVDAPFAGNYRALSPDGRTGARAVQGGVELWDGGGKEPRVTLRSPGSDYAVLFSPGGKTIVTGYSTGAPFFYTAQLWFWDVREGAKLGERKVGPTAVGRAMAWSPDGKTLACPALDNNIYFIRSPGTEVGKPLPRPGGVTSLVWSPKGDLLATVETDNQVHLLDARTGQDVVKLPAHKIASPYFVPAWSPDGKELAFATADRKVVVWNVKEKKFTFTFGGHTKDVTAAIFLMDGRTLVSGSLWSVRFWDLAENRLRGSLLKLNGKAWLAIGPDGNWRFSENEVGKQFVYKFREKDSNELRELYPVQFVENWGRKNHPEKVKLSGK
jgi:hypothetical protein